MRSPRQRADVVKRSWAAAHFPHRVAVVAIEGVVAFDLAVPCAVFAAPDVAGFRTPHYEIRVCAEARRKVPAKSNKGRGRCPRTVATADGFSIEAEFSLRVLAWADTVVVPGYAPIEASISVALRNALRASHARGARIVSICTGAFALAQAGLLDGRRATTHWAAAHLLAARYPAVEVDASALYIDDNSVCTSAGVAAGIDLCMHLVRRDFGVEKANAVARAMVVAPHRSGGQSQFADAPIPQHMNGGLGRTREYMLSHLHSSLTIEALSRHASVSPRTFARKFVAETGTTPLKWLVAQRVLHARSLLETTDEPISRVARRSGFGTAAALREHFGKATGTPPLAYRRSFRGVPAEPR